MLSWRAIYGPPAGTFCFWVWMRAEAVQRFSSIGWAGHRECHVKGELLLIYQRSPTSPLCDWERTPSCSSKRGQVDGTRWVIDGFWCVKDGAAHSQRCHRRKQANLSTDAGVRFRRKHTGEPFSPRKRVPWLPSIPTVSPKPPLAAGVIPSITHRRQSACRSGQNHLHPHLRLCFGSSAVNTIRTFLPWSNQTAMRSWPKPRAHRAFTAPLPASDGSLVEEEWISDGGKRDSTQHACTFN